MELSFKVKQDPYIFNLNLKKGKEIIEHKEVVGLIARFFDMFDIEIKTSSLFIRPEKKPEPKPVFEALNNEKPTARKVLTPWSTLAKIPKPIERQNVIKHELPTEFTIDDYADYFVRRDFPDDRVANRSTDKGVIVYEERIRNNFYHDIDALKETNPPWVEEIFIEGYSPRPKRYRVIDHTLEGRDTYILSKLLDENKVRMDG